MCIIEYLRVPRRRLGGARWYLMKAEVGHELVKAVQGGSYRRHCMLKPLIFTESAHWADSV